MAGYTMLTEVALMSLTAGAVYLLLKLAVLLGDSRLSQGWRCRAAVLSLLLFLLPVHRLWGLLPVAHIPGAVGQTVSAVLTAPMVSEARTVTMLPATTGPGLDLGTTVWLSVAFLLLFWDLFCFGRFRWQIRRAEPVKNEELLQLVPHRGRLLLYPGAPSPMLVGFFRPVILLPSEEIPPEEAELILAHELTHFRRGDLWIKLLAQLVCVLHWFNPVVYLLRRDLDRWMETSCDEQVVRNWDLSQRKAYGHLLINYSHPSHPGTRGIFTSFASPRRELERRLTIMLNSKKTSGRAVSVLLILALLCSCAAISAFAAEIDSGLDPADYGEPMAAVANSGDSVTLAHSIPGYDPVVIEGEVGDRFAFGSLIYEIIAAESVPDGTALRDDAMSAGFTATEAAPYAMLYVHNGGSMDLVFTITQSAPTGALVSGSNVVIAADTALRIYSTNPWPAATYYANFTCGKADLAGTIACRTASEIAELAG